jgi:hypothetical protein
MNIPNTYDKIYMSYVLGIIEFVSKIPDTNSIQKICLQISDLEV